MKLLDVIHIASMIISLSEKSEKINESEICCYQTNYPIKKMGRGPEQTLLPRRHTNGQQIYRKMLNFTSHWGNANQNYNETSAHTSWSGYFQQDK